MKLLHTGTKHDLCGTYSISVYIDDREYEYTVRTERDVAYFMLLYRRGCAGKALAFLKKNDVSIRKGGV